MALRESGNILVTAAIFIILEVAAVGLLKSTSTLQNIWINRFSHRIMAATWGSHEKIRGYFRLKSVNENLAEEKYMLESELRELRDKVILSGAGSEAAVLSSEYSYIPATIIGLSNNNQHNHFILNKGYEDGVTPQSGVITPQGAVGIINAVSKHYSYALSFQNTKISISARLGRNGVVAPLVWDGIHSDAAILQGLTHSMEFQPDTVWTSGFSRLFPGDIPLGIATTAKSERGSSVQAKVQLFQDFSALKYVTIVKFKNLDEIRELEGDKE